ncbi:MAG: hypothetical protein AVDCRST_MAG26-2718, partial [uncultured Chloroflexia bacterium]
CLSTVGRRNRPSAGTAWIDGTRAWLAGIATSLSSPTYLTLLIILRSFSNLSRGQLGH